MGMKSEKEHGKGVMETLGIAIDHLKEIPDYYTRLNKMEESAPKSTLDFKKQLMNNPVMAAIKKNGKKKEDEDLKDTEDTEESEKDDKDDKKKEFIKKLVALKKK
jgi:hypothetical protein